MDHFRYFAPFLLLWTFLCRNFFSFLIFLKILVNVIFCFHSFNFWRMTLFLSDIWVFCLALTSGYFPCWFKAFNLVTGLKKRSKFRLSLHYYCHFTVQYGSGEQFEIKQVWNMTCSFENSAISFWGKKIGTKARE